jgi:hypothetical protein
LKALRPDRFVVLAFFFIALGAWQAGPQSMARTLLDEARQASEFGDWESAQAYLDEAKNQDPGDADVLYLRSLCSTKRSLPIDEALGDLDAALASRRFVYYSWHEASELKAELLVRERRWEEALEALGPPRPGPVAASGASSIDPSSSLTRARALAGLGDKKAFEAEISVGLRLFPDQTAFPRLFLSKVSLIPDSDTERGLGELILSRLPRYAEADQELPVLAAPLMADLDAKRNAVLAFRSMGGASPAASLRALEYGIIDEKTAASEILNGDGSVALSDLASLFALAGSPDGEKVILGALSSWTGKIKVDADGDGIFEGLFSVAKGKVTGYDLDSRQSGVYDLHAEFQDGFPCLIRLERQGVELAIDYSAYPSAASIRFVDGKGKRGYAFGPETLTYAPILMRIFAGAGESALYFPYPNAAPEPTELACASLALSVETLNGNSRAVTQLDRGLPLSSTAYDGERIVSITDFERGRPVRIRIDADGDGRFETEGTFAPDAAPEARPEWLSTDIKGDGVYEYREQTVFPFRKEWDYEGDGSIDALQFQLADGSIQEEFSSRLDGRLDETLVIKDGRILSLMRDGVSLPLIKDANTSLTWIGEKDFDLGSNLPSGEGIFSAMGKRYRLSRVGNRAFAELIP